ncbi:MAG: hypothetical protein O2960_23485 [Verrucomicrobia bacterium]|nr:hypothetical protein [Verrucomicrobiota bacterium]
MSFDLDPSSTSPDILLRLKEVTAPHSVAPPLFKKCRNGKPFHTVLTVFYALLLVGFGAANLIGAESEGKDATLLKGLVLHSDQESILKEGDPALKVAGLQVRGSGLLASEKLTERINPLFDRVIDEGLLKEIHGAILLHYRKQGFPLVDVVFPPQTVSEGVLQVLVIESKLGKIVFEGTNKWATTDYVRKNLHVEEGQPISEKKLSSDLNWLNRSRSRSLDLYYKPGEQRFESDLVVRTYERFPLSGTVGIDNYGNRLTGGGLVSAGLEWAQPVGGNDQSVSYRYINDLDLKFLKVHLASYRIQFPWHHSLTLSGSYSEVKTDTGTSLITQEGTSYGGNLRYEVELPRIGPFRHLASAGVGIFRSDNNLEFNLVSVLADKTDTFQTTLGYTGILPDDWGNTFFGAEYTFSPGGVTSRNTDKLFATSYPFAEAKYMYTRLFLERVTRLPKEFSWRVNGTYQIADGNLTPGQQMGLGGAYTVRGYEERTVSGSEGFLISNELRAGSFSPGRWLDKTAKDEMQILGFFDYGETSNPILQIGEDPHLLLMSAGVGMRYEVSRFLSVRFDYGWQLTDPFRGIAVGREIPNSRGHVSASLSF